MLIKNILIGIISKSTGFILYYILNLYFPTSELSSILLNISVFIAIQSVIIIPTTHLATQKNIIYKQMFIVIFLVLVGVMYCFFSIQFNIFNIYVLLYLLVNTLNINNDILLLSTRRSNIYVISLSLKNIFASFATLIYISDIFLFYFLGEILRFLYFTYKFKDNNKSYSNDINLIIIFKYCLSGFMFTTPILIFKLIMYTKTTELYIYFENSMKIAELLQTSITAGLLPYFLKDLKEKYNSEIIFKITLISILYLIFVYLLNSINNYFEIIVDNPFIRNNFEFILLSILSLILINLSFIRKNFTLNSSTTNQLPSFINSIYLIIIFISLVYTLLYLQMHFIYIILGIIVYYITEYFYVYKYVSNK